MRHSQFSRSTRTLILSAGLLCTATVLAADNDALLARNLINKMTQATRSMNYDGIFIYHYGPIMDTMRIIHKADESGEYERLVSLSGSAREVIRDNNSVTCIYPNDRAVMVEKSRSRKLVFQLPQPIESVSGFYGFSTSGQDRVAGREARIVNIMPRDEYRYGYKLWIDEDTYLLLKSELRSSDRKTLEQIIFTHLNLRDHIPDELLKPSLTGKGYTWYENTQNQQQPDEDSNRWQTAWMPAGFAIKERQKQVMSTSKTPVEHLIYTDGIALVSIFIEKLGQQNPESIGPSSLGGVNTFSRLANGYQITAIGEVPQKTVQRMANSVVVGN
jgi:sigma-E factor negative regulatory protein RseB